MDNGSFEINRPEEKESTNVGSAADLLHLCVNGIAIHQASRLHGIVMNEPAAIRKNIIEGAPGSNITLKGREDLAHWRGPPKV